MPLDLDPGDRKVLIVAALVLLLLTAASLLVLRPAQRRIGYASSYSTASDGSKAAYLLLQESGYDVRRSADGPAALPADPRGYVLVLADPFVSPSREERAALAAFVRNGGRVLATGFASSALLPEDDSQPGAPQYDWKSYPALAPSPITLGAREIRMHPYVRWGDKYPTHVPLFGDGEGPVVVTYPYGRGDVVWWSDSTPLTNAGLREASDLELFLNSLGPRDRVHVLWDEYYHGERAGMWSHLRATPTPWALLQLALVGFFILLTFSRRNGPVRMPFVEPRLSPLEFVDTVGSLYHKARAHSAAVAIAYKRFRYLLARQAGVAVTARPAAVCEAVGHRPGADDQLLDVLRDCELALYDPGFAQERGLDLVRRLNHYVAAMRLLPATPEETR